MNRIKFSVIFLVLLSMFLLNCDSDSSTGSSQSQFFIYGLLGIEPGGDTNDSSNCWVYARVFNHPDHENVEAELEHNSAIIPLEGNYFGGDKFFTDFQSGFSFNSNEKYTIRFKDAQKSYSGMITTLPRIDITEDTVINNQIVLSWTDIGADFYNVEFTDYLDLEEQYQVKNTQFILNMDDLPIGDDTYSINIIVAGLKGMDPWDNPDGNIGGCHGYVFAYSQDQTRLNPGSMTFSKSISEEPPNLDDLVLSLMNRESIQSATTSGPAFQFTYAQIDRGWDEFYNITLAEPLNSITSIEGSLNDLQLNYSNWNGFLYSAREWNMDIDSDVFQYKLSINNQKDSATVSLPDTFSIIGHPSTVNIPEVPFVLEWRQPDFADFFIVDVSWEVEGDTSDVNHFYVVDDISLTVTEKPSNVISAYIEVQAVSGANPFKRIDPNLKRLNGYFYVIQPSENSLYFNSGLNKVLASPNDPVRSHNRVNQFLLDSVSKQYPELEGYSIQLQE